MDEEDIKNGSRTEEHAGDEEQGAQSAPEASRQDEDQPLEELSREGLIERIQSLQQSRDENYELYLRSQAEMENMKKRHRKEKKDWQRFANEKLVKEILPVMDNLETALSHTAEENALAALKEGVELTLKGLREVLGRAGVEEVKTEGEGFDPGYHEAISVQEDPNRSKGAILHELQKGYLMNGRLIRPALVVVNQGGSDEGEGLPSEEAFES